MTDQQALGSRSMLSAGKKGKKEDRERERERELSRKSLFSS